MRRPDWFHFIFFTGLNLASSYRASGLILLAAKNGRSNPSKPTPGGQTAANAEKDYITTLTEANLVAESFGIRKGSTAPRWVWKYSWRLLGYVLPILHVRDKARTKDLDYSLKCLWCKALSERDPTSPAFDPRRYTYDMLPSGTRSILKLPNRLFPRLIHFNIEIRTAFLDGAVRNEILQVQQQQKYNNIQLVTLGAGYDVRSVQLLGEELVDEAYEFDMAPVIDSKRIMLSRLEARQDRRRYRKRRRNDRKKSHSHSLGPELLVQDLNNIEALKEQLSSIFKGKDDSCYTIFLLEGVMIYLESGVPHALLKLVATMLVEKDLSGSIVFADLLRELKAVDSKEAKRYISTTGWQLDEGSWRVKPGLARHMGVARVGGGAKF